MRRAEQPIVGVFLRLLLQDFVYDHFVRIYLLYLRSIVTSAKTFYIIGHNYEKIRAYAHSSLLPAHKPRPPKNPDPSTFLRLGSSLPVDLLLNPLAELRRGAYPNTCPSLAALDQELT